MSWVTEDEADTYFATRYGAAQHWASGTDKTAALATAYCDLIDCGDFEFEDVASGEEAEQELKDAQCEQALFIIQQGAAIDLRAALQEQGVASAGIMQEGYDGRGARVPISPRARAMLSAYARYGLGFKTAPIDAGATVYSSGGVDYCIPVNL